MPDVHPGGDNGHFLIIGPVIGIFIDDNFIKDGIVNTADMRPLARMGYMDYGVITPETAFELRRPVVKEDGSVERSQRFDWQDFQLHLNYLHQLLWLLPLLLCF